MQEPELRQLLTAELRRHLAGLLLPGCALPEARKLLHAAKGSAAMAGERPLAEALARLERRARAGDTEVIARGAGLLELALANLQEGRPASQDPWPLPPEDLKPPSVSPASFARYSAEMRDRIGLLDQPALQASDPVAACEQAFRQLHTIKGAALAVGDDVLVWFCHGLEARLRAGSSGQQAATSALQELTRWRAVLAELVEDPARALDSLRSMAGRRAGSTHPPDGASVRAEPAPHPEPGWLRVPASSLDRVLDRIGRLASSSTEYRLMAELASQLARSLRAQRASLLEAQRLIGPPRPWGAPAAAIRRLEQATTQLAGNAERLGTLATRSRLLSRSVRQEVTLSQADLGAMRQATMEFVFEPARAAAEAAAQQQGRLVHVAVTGASVPVGRRLAEALVDPIVQLARNAVAHGIEPAQARKAAGKPDVGTVELTAEVRGVHLVVRVHDDGAGVDFAALREHAVREGVLSEELARTADDELLVQLLFLPGLTTREGADLLAGRGVGLAIVQHAVRRMGGSIRVVNRRGRGLDAVIEVPLAARGVVSALWVTSLKRPFALSSAGVVRVSLLDRGQPAPPALAHCIDPSCVGIDAPGYIVQVEPDYTGRQFSFGVETVRALEQVAVRPLPPLVAASGPYAGVIISPGGTPTVLLDPLRMASRRR